LILRGSSREEIPMMISLKV